MLWSLIIVALFFSTEALECTPRTGGTPVPLGVFISGETEHGKEAPDAEGPIRMALNYIQNHSCILNGFKLELIYKDTGCKTSSGMRALFELIAARPRPYAIFGGICTEVNEPVAMALKYWHIVQLSYAETHAKFASVDSQELYPTFFRIVPGDRNLNRAKCDLINHFGWKKVGTIKQSDESRHALPHETLTTRLENGYGIRIVYTAGVTSHEKENIAHELEILRSRDVRVIIMDVAEDMAPVVLCEAYRKEMYGDNYVWILPGYHSTNFTRKSGINCSQKQLSKVLENHFATQWALHRKDGHVEVVGGRTANEIWHDLTVSSNTVYRGYLYDGLWALAIALRQSLGTNAEFNHTKLLQAIYSTSFEGVTGRVQFENNERLGLVDLLQWKEDRYVNVGQYDGSSNNFTIHTDKLGDWIAPLDSTIKEVRPEYISYSLFIVMSFMALIGISLALIFLFINIKYRNHRFIKMSSPNLNNIIIVGSLCTYASVIFLGVDTRFLSSDNFVKLCYAKSWTLCLGFTLSFGSMFSKTWRVHSIFTNIRMDRKAIKDSKLLMILGFLLMVDIIVLTVWAIVSPFSLDVTELPLIQMDNKVVIPVVERCKSENSMIFQACLYATKGVLMVLGCFLAWETRHVNVPALNDSKYIGMSVYGVVVMSILGLSISVILQEKVNEAFALTSIFIIFSTTVTLCFVFVPKIIELVRNPQGNEQRGYRRGMMKSMVTKSGPSSQQGSSATKEVDREILAKAEAENQLRRRYLHQKSTQLWDLLEKLREMGDTKFLQQDWCYVSGSSFNNTASTENDRLLGGGGGQHSNIATESTSLGFTNGTDWPWVDPEEPSTKL